MSRSCSLERSRSLGGVSWGWGEDGWGGFWRFWGEDGRGVCRVGERDVLVEIDAAVGEFAEGSLLLELCRGDGLVSAGLLNLLPISKTASRVSHQT